MSFNIAEFSAQVARRGLARNNLHLVQITLPNTLRYLEDNITTRELTFLCKTTTLPSFELDTVELRPQGFGVHEQRPTDIRMSRLPMQFMVDGNFGTVKFFHRWMQGIVNYNSYDGFTRQDPQGKLPYEFEYKENYTARIDILLYSGNDTNKVYFYSIDHAFPVSIGEVSSSWENQSEVMTLDVAFEYDKFRSSALEIGQVLENSALDRGNGVLGYISAINGFGQTINSLSRPTSIQDLINKLTTVNTIFNAL